MSRGFLKGVSVKEAAVQSASLCPIRYAHVFRPVGGNLPFPWLLTKFQLQYLNFWLGYPPTRLDCIPHEECVHVRLLFAINMRLPVINQVKNDSPKHIF